jgi:carbon monoxide dehydrogenase subunit G
MGIKTASATAEIDAPIEAVWKVVEDVAIAPDWQGGLVSLEPLERDDLGRVRIADTGTDAKVRTIHIRTRFDYAPPTELSFEQVKGMVKHGRGYWQLEDLGSGRTRATYALEGDLGRVLDALIRGPLYDLLVRLLVGARPEELKQRVEVGS